MVLPEPGSPTMSMRLFEDSKAATMSSATFSEIVSGSTRRGSRTHPKRGVISRSSSLRGASIKGSLDQLAACPVGAGLHLLAQLWFELADSLLDCFRTLLLGPQLSSQIKESDSDPRRKPHQNRPQALLASQ